ncbi:MAG: LicD family protein [Eubacterium sp.]|nr:LicD family protein [Eubacterium sp.]
MSLEKIWAVELDILKQIDRVCKKNDISYYAEYGTLLGAVRHKGMIPWDDDIDISMPRKEYMRFKEVAREEFRHPYAYVDGYTGYAVTPMSKVVRVDTSAVERPDLPPEYPQGIFVDVMPLDAVSDDSDEAKLNWLRLLEYWSVIKSPIEVFDQACAGKQFVLGVDRIIELAQMQGTDKLRELEKFALSVEGTSEKINVFLFQIKSGGGKRDVKWYEETVYLPFEDMEIPAPAGWHEVLSCVYGDYMTPIKGAGVAHAGAIFDTERPYTYYLDANKKDG